MKLILHIEWGHEKAILPVIKASLENLSRKHQNAVPELWTRPWNVKNILYYSTVEVKSFVDKPKAYSNSSPGAIVCRGDARQFPTRYKFINWRYDYWKNLLSCSLAHNHTEITKNKKKQKQNKNLSLSPVSSIGQIVCCVNAFLSLNRYGYA